MKKNLKKERNIIIIISILIIIAAVADFFIITGNASIGGIGKESPGVIGYPQDTITPTFLLVPSIYGPSSVTFLADTEDYVLNVDNPVEIQLKGSLTNTGISSNEFASMFINSYFQDDVEFQIKNSFYTTGVDTVFGITRYVYANEVSWDYGTGKFASVLDLDSMTITDISNIGIFYCKEWDFDTTRCLVPWSKTTDFVIEYNDANTKAAVIGNITEKYEAYAIIELYPYVCGDINSDREITLVDLTYLIQYLFRGGPAPNPMWVADVNKNGDVTVGDITYLIAYLFRGGPEPQCNPSKSVSLGKNPTYDGKRYWTYKQINDELTSAQNSAQKKSNILSVK